MNWSKTVPGDCGYYWMRRKNRSLEIVEIADVAMSGEWVRCLCRIGCVERTLHEAQKDAELMAAEFSPRIEEPEGAGHE